MSHKRSATRLIKQARTLPMAVDVAGVCDASDDNDSLVPFLTVILVFFSFFTFLAIFLAGYTIYNFSNLRPRSSIKE